MLKKGEIKCGDIIWAQFSPSVGHEFMDKRPALVIQSNSQLAKSNLVTVMPITSNGFNRTADDITIPSNTKNNLKHDSVVKVYDIVSFDYLRFYGIIGVAEQNIMEKIKAYLKRHFGL